MTGYLEKNIEPHSHGQLLKAFAAHQSNYWVGFVSDPATASFFLFWESQLMRSNRFVLAACYTSGLLSWTLFEYMFHRWVYHRGRTLAHAGHRLHHESPTLLIGMPWFMTTGFLWGVWYVLGYRFHVQYVLGWLAGLTTGFIAYGAVHHILHHHHHRYLNDHWFKKLNAHHLIHHRFPEVNFGVTNRFWDKIFGTSYQQQKNSLLKDDKRIGRNVAAAHN